MFFVDSFMDLSNISLFLSTVRNIYLVSFTYESLKLYFAVISNISDVFEFTEGFPHGSITLSGNQGKYSVTLLFFFLHFRSFFYVILRKVLFKKNYDFKIFLCCQKCQ